LSSDSGTPVPGADAANTVDGGGATPQADSGGVGPGVDGGGTTPGQDATGGSGSEPTADLRADTNRNGVIDWDDPTEDEGEDDWTAEHGAVFLANIDDDLVACPTSGAGINDLTLPDCNDAADTVVNGEDDLLDMAPLRVAALPDAPDGAAGYLDLGAYGTDRARLFIQRNGEWMYFNPRKEALTAAELRAGVNLLLEGRDVLRDTKKWDGKLTVELTVDYGGKTAVDTVMMRVAPMILFHHLLPAEVVTVTTFSYPESTVFRQDLEKALAAMANPPVFDEMVAGDQWNQDFFETAYMSMPSADGQHVIRVYLRSANVFNPKSATNPLRPAGKTVFTHFRGKDAAAVQEFDLGHDGNSDTLNSTGNTETIPPYSKDGEDFPLGRLYNGEVESFAMDQKWVGMLNAQGMQPRVTVDTSWLLVGHVDETLTFIKADTPRGWTIVRNDAMMAIDMLQKLEDEGHGDVPMFVGKDWDANQPAEVTISQVLDDTDVIAETTVSAAEVDAQIEILKNVTGITDDEMIRIPFLHWAVYGYSVAYQPGTVNTLYIDGTNLAVPDPHGPKIDGKDVMKEQWEQELSKVGMTTHWIENWDLYHALLGEVHCGTNAVRATPDVKWWETGR
jgi:protein-arginine deiminase